jgi:hypothetical protein
MTGTNSPLASARSTQGSARYPPASPRKEPRVPSASHVLPPIKTYEPDISASARGTRPNLLSARSDASVNSNRSAQLSAKVKISPYATAPFAIPASARSGNSSARNTPSPRLAVNLKTATEEKVCSPRDVVSSASESQIETSPRPHVDEQLDDVAQTSGHGAAPGPNLAPSIHELVEIEEVDIGAGGIAIIEEEHARNEPVQHELTEEEAASDHAEENANPSQVCETLPLTGENISQSVAYGVDSAISSVFCNNATMIASIPEEMELTTTYDDERNVGAPSPPEPSPTPVEGPQNETAGSEGIQTCLNKALIEVSDTPIRGSSSVETSVVNVASPSPILGTMSLSRFSAESVEDLAITEAKIQEEISQREIPKAGPRRERRSGWHKMFCCRS